MLHGVFLRSQDRQRYTATARALASGAIEGAELLPEEVTLLAYATKLTRSPATVSDEDIAALHAAGWDDAQVWEATVTIAIFNMFNRMADAFGLTPPEQAVAALERDP